METSREKPRLILEAAVLQHGFTWGTLPPPAKLALRQSSSSGIKLFEIEMAWHNPMPCFDIFTSPGLNYTSPNIPLAQDFIVRWCLNKVRQEGKKGRTVTTEAEWLAYLQNPQPTNPQDNTRYSLVVNFSPDPVLMAIGTGMYNIVERAGQVRHFQTNKPYNQPVPSCLTSPPPTVPDKLTVVRRGKLVQISRPSSRKVATPTAPPKYSRDPLPQFRLAASALPANTPPLLLKRATHTFAASVSRSTQSTYKTALNHLNRIEQMLGRSFSNPPSDGEMVLFVSYLAERGVSKATAQSYLSGIRFLSLSRGAPRHTAMPELGSQLLAGMANCAKDASKEAMKPKRRPITINMLMLLSNSIDSEQKWSVYEKSLRWCTILLAYWGSFRMGELLANEKSQFNPSTALMPSDLRLHSKSIAVWIRSPKVWSFGGDVVEVWQVSQNKLLDPLSAVKTFMRLRSAVLGLTDDLPLLAHSDGSLYYKSELNRDLKLLLSRYPTLESPRDLWSGHSFRSGISSLLTSLGFSEDQIKQWGRWHSSAYTAYVQDKTERRRTMEQFTSTFGRMLATI